MSNTAPTATPGPSSLPTGRTNPFDPPPELTRFREREPLRRLTYPDGHLGWLVTSYALARAVLSDPRFSHRMELQRPPVSGGGDALYGHPAPPGIFINMDPPEHTRYRRLLTGQFTVRRMNQLRPRVEQIVDHHLNLMEEAGPPVDLVEAFALPIPSLTICELLGVPYRDHPEFHRLNEIITSNQADASQGAAAFQALIGFFHDLIQRKRRRPADDLLSGLIESGELNDEEVVGIGLLLHRAGHETTAGMLSLGTFSLLTHPRQMQQLRADPSLIDNTVEELLRYLTILQFGNFRTAIEDVELDGQLIKTGESVTISLPAANRDPERFEEPDEFDISREAKGHLAFGHGIHQCLGQQLARIEMRVGYASLIQRFPSLRLAVRPEEVPLRSAMGFYGAERLPVVWEQP